MEKKSFEIAYTEGKFWIQREDAKGPYEEELNSCDWLNNLSKGLMWTVSIKETIRSRKWKSSSAMTKTIEAQLDLVKDLLKYNHLVMVQTPDVEVILYKG